MSLQEILPKLYPVLGVLITISVGFFFYFLKSDKPEGWIIAALTFWILLGVLGASIAYQIVFSETETSGLLRPASEPTPPTPCQSVPKDALLVLLGNSASFTTSPRFTVLEVAGENLLSVDRKNGGITVSAKIYSADRKLVAEIIDNAFHLNPSNYFRRERPDRHTLAVFDHQGQRVLYIRYINASAIKVLGTFFTLRGKILINENEMILANAGRFTGFCLGASMVAIKIE